MRRPLRSRWPWVVVLALVGAVLARRRSARAPASPLPPLPDSARVGAVIPVLDEAGTIGGVIAEVRAAGIDRIVVVDGGSSDGSPDVARAAGAVVVEERRRGYGRACRAGADAIGTDVIAFLDGDASDDPAYLPSLVGLVVDGRAALALGARRSRAADAMLPHQRFGNRIVTWLVWLFHDVRVDDVPPMRVIRADVLRSLELREETYGWPTEMLVATARAGLPIAEVDVVARRRGAGESKIAGRLGPSLAAGVRMIGVVLRAG